MSGIAGMIRFDGGPVQPGLIEKMTSAMAYRGPDGINHWTKGSVAFGQCMTRTTPESLEETQPHTNENESLVLVMDGWLSNWEELRAQLLKKNARLRTRADAELVLRAYEVWGKGCLARIDGDFAIVIWDARKREAFCARDRLGGRPFYYWRQAGCYAFASDLHALLTLPRSPRTVNEGMIAEHLIVRVESLSETLITGINRLPPAKFHIVSNFRFEEHRYWDLDFKFQLRYSSDLEYYEHYLYLFDDTIRRQMRSIGTVGCYLSGGIDSSSVFCIAAKRAGAQKPIESLSLVFPGLECDERRYIKAVNQICDAPGNYLSGGPAPFQYHIDQVEKFRDVCLAPNGTMPNTIWPLALKKNITVILTGYGGDEWFGQNHLYYAHLLKGMNLAALVRQCHREIQNGKAASQLSGDLFFRGVVPLIPKKVRASIRRIRSQGAPKNSIGIVHSDLARKVSLQDRLNVVTDSAAHVDPAYAWRRQFLDLGWNVRGAEMNNRQVARFGFDERSPFLDRRMIEFACALPEPLLSQNDGKYIVRQSMRGILPEIVRLRRDKAEFGGSLAGALVAPEAREFLDCRRLATNGWVNGAAVQEQSENFRALYLQGDNGYKDYVWPLWMAVVLEMWTASMRDVTTEHQTR